MDCRRAQETFSERLVNDEYTEQAVVLERKSVMGGLQSGWTRVVAAY